MKWRRRSRKRRFSNTPSSRTCSWVSFAGASSRPRDRAPRLEPFLAGAQRADAGLHAVGDDQRGVGGEEGLDLRLVGLELLERRPDRRVLVGRVLELDDGQREPVDEDHHVGPARVLPVGHGELVDRQPVVVVGVVEVDHPGLRPGDGAVLAAVLHRDAVHQQPVNGAVAFQQGRGVGARELAVGVLQCLGRQFWIQLRECLSQAAFEDDVAVVRVGTFGGGFSDRDVRAVEDRVPQCLQPSEGGVFDDGFGEVAAHPSPSMIDQTRW